MRSLAFATQDARPSMRPATSDTHKHAMALCRALGISEPQLMLLVQRCPDTFSFSPEAMAASVQAIASLTGLQACQVPQLLLADPSLLLQPDNLKLNLQELSQALQVPPQEVAQLAAREPQVLALTGQQAEARVSALSEILQATPRRVVESVLDSPGLLVQTPEEVEAQLDALQAFLAASRDLVAPVVLAKPSLLGTPPQLLAQRAQHLAAAAGLDAHDVLRRAAAGPDLLAASSCFTERRCRELGEQLGCSEGHVAHMVVLHPRLLNQPPGTVLSKWRLVCNLAATHGAWTAQLGDLNPNERGALLEASYVTMARLRYLVDLGLQKEVELLAAVAVSDVQWLLQYPAFKDWLRA